jgi:hypothetical protein
MKQRACKIYINNLKNINYFGDLGVELRIILKYSLGEWIAKTWAELNWLRIWSYGGIL